MPYSRSHINNNGSFNTGQKSSLLKTFDELEAGTGSLTPQAAPAAAPEPFASLTTAAQYVNSLRAALIASGILT